MLTLNVTSLWNRIQRDNRREVIRERVQRIIDQNRRTGGCLQDARARERTGPNRCRRCRRITGVEIWIRIHHIIIQELIWIQLIRLPEKIDRFDGKVFLAASYLSEEEATVAIADREAFFDTMATHPGISREVLLAAARHNLGLHREEAGDLEGLERKELVAGMLRRKALMIVVTIGGVGIKAVGMPEMCVISHDINYNPMLADTCLLLTDVRISATNKGFVIVHLEPEAYERGPILGVTTGDLVHLDLDASRNTQYLNLIDPDKFSAGGEIIPLSEAAVRAKVDAVAEERLEIVESHRALLEPFLLGDLEGLSNAFAGGTPLPLMAAGREAN